MSKPKAQINRLEKFLNNSPLADQAIRMLQEHIQIRTINPPGNEMDLAIIIKKHFESLNCDFIETHLIESTPNRGNLVIIIKGSSSSDHKTWEFASHLDVVPVKEEHWIHPPFSGKIIQEEHDRFIWGRGALDMKQTGVSYIIAITTLINEGFRPKGDLKLIFEADEERSGVEGMKFLIDHHWDLIKCDYFLTEGGGAKLPTGPDFILQRGEKGMYQIKLKVKGVSGHGATPDPYDQMAIYKIVKILKKIQKHPQKIHYQNLFYEMLEKLSLPGIAKFFIKRKALIRPLLHLVSKITNDPLEKVLIPLVSDTIAPTMLNAGTKINVISIDADLSLDIRNLPGHTPEFIQETLKQKLGKKLYNQIEFEILDNITPTISPINTPLFQIIENKFKEIYPRARLIPYLGVGGTDMKHMRLKDVICYGFVPLMKDEDMSYAELTALSHSPNERISVNNLMLSTDFAYRLMKQI